MPVLDEIATIPLINAAFLLLRPSITSAPPTATIFALRPSLLRGCLAQARAASPLQRILGVHSSAIAKSPGASPDIVEYSRPLFQYPRHQRARIASKMSSSDDDTPLVRAKDQGEFVWLPTQKEAMVPRASCPSLTRRPHARSPKLFLSCISYFNLFFIHRHHTQPFFTLTP